MAPLVLLISLPLGTDGAGALGGAAGRHTHSAMVSRWRDASMCSSMLAFSSSTRLCRISSCSLKALTSWARILFICRRLSSSVSWVDVVTGGSKRAAVPEARPPESVLNSMLAHQKRVWSKEEFNTQVWVGR